MVWWHCGYARICSQDCPASSRLTSEFVHSRKRFPMCPIPNIQWQISISHYIYIYMNIIYIYMRFYQDFYQHNSTHDVTGGYRGRRIPCAAALAVEQSNCTWRRQRGPGRPQWSPSRGASSSVHPGRWAFFCRNALKTSENCHCFSCLLQFFPHSPHLFRTFPEVLQPVSPLWLRPHSPAEAAEGRLVGGGPLAPQRRGRRGARRRLLRGAAGAAGLGALRSAGEGPRRVARCGLMMVWLMVLVDWWGYWWYWYIRINDDKLMDI